MIAPGETLSFLSELGVALLLFSGRTGILPRRLLARAAGRYLMAGALQMIARGPAADPAIDVVMGQPGQSAALLGTAAAMSSTALVSPTTGRPRRAHHPPRTQCHRRAGLSGPGQRAPAGPCWRSGRAASRRRSSMCCSKYSVCCCCFAAAAPRLRAVCCMAAGLGGAAGATRAIVRARLLVRGGGRRRRCARGRRICRPGGLSSPGMVLGETRLPAPHGKPPQAVSRCVVGRVLRDHRPATGRSTDSFGTAGGAGVG